MDQRREMQDFLVSRRARITPEQAGLTVYGSNRRVKGLRREEVAMLAGVSVDYYTRLERGSQHNASDTVLDAIARALQLDEDERTHLFDLARANQATPAGGSRRRSRAQVRPTVQVLLDALTLTPAYVRNGRLDLLGTNRMGLALFTNMFDEGVYRPVNLARFIFLQPQAHDFYDDWEVVARDLVGALRVEAGRHPHDKALSDLVGELSTRSQEFRIWWASHNVRRHLSVTKRLTHPVIGPIELTGEGLSLSDDGLTLITYLAEPGSPAEEGLAFLSSWVPTSQSVDRHGPTRD